MQISLQRLWLICAGLLFFGLGIVSHAEVPTNLTVSSTTAVSISLSWTNTAGAGFSFRLERRNVDSDWYEIAEIDSPESSYIDNAVLCNHSYQYRIRLASVAYELYTDYLSETNTVSASALPCLELNVTTTGDGNDGLCDATNCTLREAIISANTVSSTSATAIHLPAGIYTVGPALPDIVANMHFIGTDAATTIFDDISLNIRSGGSQMLLQNLTFRGGEATRIYVSAGSRVKIFALYGIVLEINNSGALQVTPSRTFIEIRNSIVKDLTTDTPITLISSDSLLLIEGNSFIANSYEYGLLDLEGSDNRAYIRNNTFSGNVSSAGKGIFDTAGSFYQLMLEHNTFAYTTGLIIHQAGYGDPVINYRANIFLDSSQCLSNETVNSLGANITLLPLSCDIDPGDISSTSSPILEPLLEVTSGNLRWWIHPLSSDSIARDLLTECPLSYDQLGRTRPANVACDSGAVEGDIDGYWPSHLKASFDTASVNLSWIDTFDDETAYSIERSEDGATWTEIAQVAANSSAYIDSSLNCPQVFTYRLRAYFAGTAGYSAYGNNAEVEVYCYIPAPSNLRIPSLIPPSSDFIALEWLDNSNTETTFIIERSADGGASWTIAGQVGANQLSFSDEGIPCNSSFKYRVRAYDSATDSYSLYSNVLDAATMACIEPPANSVCTLRRLITSVPISPLVTQISGDGSRVGVLAEDLMLFNADSGALLATIPDATLAFDLSDDGQTLIFGSEANYTAENADGNHEYFLWKNGVYTQLTHSSFTTDAESFVYISGDGSTLIFPYRANLFTDTELLNGYHLYVWQEGLGLSFLTPEVLPDAFFASFDMGISDDGNTIIFEHTANLTGDDPDNDGMLYRKDTTTGLITTVGGPDVQIDYLSVNGDASRLAGANNAVTATNPDGNYELFGWDSLNGWQQLTDTSEANDRIMPSLDDSGNRVLFASDLNFTGDYFLYDETLGLSELSNHQMAWVYVFDGALSDDGIRAALLLTSKPNVPDDFQYWRIYIAECPQFLASPTTLQTAQNISVVNLNWNDAVADEASYLIERSSNGGASWSVIAELPANSSSYEDSDLTCSTYQYRIRAHREWDNSYSAYSNTSAVNVSCPIIPPAGLSAGTILRGSDFAGIGWYDYATNETDFSVERRELNGIWAQIAQAVNPYGPNTFVSHTDEHLSCETTYQYRVRAYSSVTGQYSLYTNIITIDTDGCWQTPPSSICTVERFYPEIDPWVYNAVLSGNGSRIVMTGDNASLNLLDVATGSLLTTIIHTSSIFDISYDGHQIAFSSETNLTGQNADGNLELFLWNNGVISQITNTININPHGSETIYPQMSADGTTIVFNFPGVISTNTRSDDLHYYYVWTVSSGIQPILSTPTSLPPGLDGFYSAPIQITHDGEAFVFYHRGNLLGLDPANEGMIYGMGNGSTSITALTDKDVMPNFAANATGSRIVFSSSRFSTENPDGFPEYFIWDNTTGQRQITHTNGENYHYEVSMDASGYRLIFTSAADLTGENPDIPPYEEDVEYFLYEQNLGFSQLSDSPFFGHWRGRPSISDDGTRVAFVYTARLGLSEYDSQQHRVYIADCPATETIPAPTNLLASNPSETTTINLSWIDNASTESVYLLEKSSDNGTSWELLETLPANSTSYSLTNQSCGINYQFRVRSYSATVYLHSAYSNIAEKQISCGMDAPTNLVTSNPSGTATVNLAWNDNASGESAYIIERSSDNAATWQVYQTQAANSTNYSILAQNCGTTYHYRLRAFNSTSSQYSAYSNTAQALISCAIAAPNNFAVTAIGFDTISLSWNDNSWNETSFFIEISFNGSSWNPKAELPANSSSTTFQVVCESGFSLRIRARDIGTNNYSASSNVLSNLSLVCGPYSLRATPTYNSIALTWVDYPTNETNYEIERKIGNGAWEDLLILPANSSSYTDTSLECQTSYSYRIRAYRSTDNVSSDWRSIISSSSTCPALVASSLSTTASTENSISLNWTVDTTATTFTLWAYNGVAWTNLGSFNRSNHSFTHSGLACASGHQYRVQTYRQQDNATAYSAVFSARSAACASLLAPSSPIILSVDTAFISLQIPTMPAGATSLRLERSTDGTNWQVLGTALGSYLDSSVQCATVYYYRLVAIRGADESSASSVVTTTTPTCPSPILSNVGIYQNGRWLFLDVNGNSSEINFGAGTGWQSLTGDWDGDGEDGIGLYKDGVFIIRSSLTATDDSRFNFGSGSGWQAIAGDWDGDAVDSVGLFKDGLFILSNNNAIEAYRFNFGSGSGWQAIAGDWDGNGADTIGLYKNGLWQLTDSVSDPQLTRSFAFGPEAANWFAVAGDWNGDGVDGIGIFGFGSWRLRETASAGAGERVFLFGDTSAGWMPIASNPFVPVIPPEVIPVLDDDDDSDGLSNGDENLVYGTDSLDADSDDDALNDGTEIILHETNPLDGDSDDDLLNDGAEVLAGTDPNDSDSDDDGLSDSAEITAATNPNDSDSDDDGLSDGVESISGSNPNDSDSDDDGLSDSAEINTYNTNPIDANSDDDDMNDFDEIGLCRNPNNPGDTGILTSQCPVDTDSDGLEDEDETNTYGTNPFDGDTDNDGLLDGAEVNSHITNPNQADSDSDGLSDSQEVSSYLLPNIVIDGLASPVTVNTHPTNPDTDSDGLSDGDEFNAVFGYYLNPADMDTDNDNLSDADEINIYETWPILTDTDGDGMDDGAETLIICRHPDLDDAWLTDCDHADWDTDSDLLDDKWEYRWFGCMLEGFETTVAIRPGGYLVYIPTSDYIASSWNFSLPIVIASDPTIPSLRASANFPADCATTSLAFDAVILRTNTSTWPAGCILADNDTVEDTSDDYLSDCRLPNTAEFLGTEDPDGDYLNNVVEAIYDLNPLNLPP